MNATQGIEVQGRRTHPVVLAAGVAVLLFSLLGAAAITGLLPSAVSVGSNAGGTVGGTAARAACADCGVIESIRAVEVQGKTSGVGAVAGGVAGGVVGNQLGGSSSGARTVLTIGGAAGGAFAGDAIEKHMKKHTAWRVTVRMRDGASRTVSQATQPPFAVGDRVRIVNGSTLERV